MVKDEYYNMARLEHSHWWYRSLHLLVLKHIQKHFCSKEINIIDAGCGTGGLMYFLKKKGYQKVEGFDLSETALKICNQNGFFVFRGDLRNIADYYMENFADVIISNDTFYFLSIDEQRNLTDKIYRLLRKDGVLITNMPSLKAFRGNHDVQVGIQKRFEEEDIWKVFDRKKYSLVTKTYWPFLLSPIIWISRYIQRLKIKFNPQSAIRSDLKDEGRIINSILLSVTKTENYLFDRKPFGTSLFLLMKKQ
jgi:SAM-dependent methyltransferase